MPEILLVAGREDHPITQGHGIQQTVPQRLWSSLDLHRMLQTTPRQRGFPIPSQYGGPCTVMISASFRSNSLRRAALAEASTPS